MGRFGLVSLGHGGFMGIGAYGTALLWNYFHITPWFGIPLAVAAVVVTALVIACPCFRFRIIGHYFALVTLALSAMVLQILTAARDITGGSLGYTPQRYNGGNSIYALQFTDKTTWYLIALVIWAVGLFIRYRVDRSMLRYALEAIAEDEDAAAAAGVHVTWEKLKITVLSAGDDGFAGALYCQYQMFISPDTVSGISVSLQMVFAAVVGGIYVLLGPTVGAFITICSRKPAHRVRHQCGRMGQHHLRQPAGDVHHLPAAGTGGRCRRSSPACARRRGSAPPSQVTIATPARSRAEPGR